MNRSAVDTYRARFRKILEYIDAHLDDDLTVERLSDVAAFSKYHFHRQFSALFGTSVYTYVRLTRLKRAAYQLAFRDRLQIVDIALTSGYETHESFARAFKNSIGQTPSAFRARPQWHPWHLIYQPLSDSRRKYMNPDLRPEQIEIILFKETKVATLEHRGDPNSIGDSIRKLIEWRKQNHLPPQISNTFNILYDHPSATAPENFRLDICASTERSVPDNPFGVVEKTIPGGRCAVLRSVGDDANLERSIAYLYSNWLPLSGEELRDFPLFLQRIEFFPDVPEHEAINDVFLPLK